MFWVYVGSIGDGSGVWGWLVGLVGLVGLGIGVGFLGSGEV